MTSRKLGRIVDIRPSSAGRQSRCSASPTARSGLTGFLAGLARQVRAHNVTTDNLLPGRFATARMRLGLAFQAQKTGRPLAELETESRAQLPAGRFGDPAEFGELCAFICGARGSYIVGHDFLIDSGFHSGTY